MKRKIIWIVSLLMLTFLILHIREIGNYFHNSRGAQLYANGDYTGALDSFQRARDFKDTLPTEYNMGITKYSLGEYPESQDIFNQILDQNPDDETEFKSLYSLGNTFYQLGQTTSTIGEMIEMYERSIDAYTQALVLKQDPETSANKAYVEKELEKLKKQQQEMQDKQNQDESKGGDDESGKTPQNNQSGKTGTGASDNQDKQSNAQRDESYMLDQSKTVPEITQEEKNYLEGYRDFLERLQKENQGNFNQKVKPQSDFFDLFGADPFFQDSIGSDEKDW